ncbi:MAG: PIG-L family deacetylase [Microthrixaceae bacterium]|nr:PIG-L family deacetylase [Acidimicrobiales bacterium]MCB9403341.1 PIG-L family deacetylase [Microthrixaceae bacterium]
MGTIVSFHAHPDDESIATSGLLARAADAGHRVVLVFATRGELGTPVDGVLDEDEQLALRRTAECYESASVIGAHRVEFLGFTDSGMEGDATNDAPWCFWQADVDHAARRLAIILEEEQADVITVYDDHGGYGHPDHIQVHRVGRRAAEMADVAVVAQSTMNRDHINRARAAAVELGVDLGDDIPPELPDSFGSPESIITHSVDTRSVIHRKRSSMLAHGSQIGADHFMAAMPLEAFEFVFGTEWFIVDSVPADPPTVFADLFEPTAPGG